MRIIRSPQITVAATHKYDEKVVIPKKDSWKGNKLRLGKLKDILG